MAGMRTYRRAAHTVYEVHYHFVFTPKSRKPVLRGEIAKEVRDLIRQICRSNDIEILAGQVRPAHGQLRLSVLPHLAPSRVRQAIKGQSSPYLRHERRSLRQEFWGQHLWARGYCVCSSGNVTDEMIQEYLRTQGAEPQDDERFKVSE